MRGKAGSDLAGATAHRSTAWLGLIATLALALGSVWSATPAQASGSISEFRVPTTGSSLVAITPGPDGALWFTEGFGGNKIGRITTAGTISEFAVPTTGSDPDGITAGPDGALWFTEFLGNKIGRITTAGSVSEFAVPTAASDPDRITAGPDGALWFTEFLGNKIGRVTTSGTFSEFAVPTAASFPNGITAGPDGALWFTERVGNQIGRIATAGSVSEFALPTAGSDPLGIAAGPDGALWFTELAGNKIGRISPGSQTFLGGGAGNGTAFVIGDRNAAVGTAVTFWRAQWAKANALSGGPAPATFKGFADRTSTTPPTCGGTWTTRPGNSSNPPASVPAFMAVIVSSSIGKSGAAISGNALHIVVVKTNPGYAPNPGHPGTGTVVAVLC